MDIESVTVINDCCDGNSKARIEREVLRRFESMPVFVPILGNHDGAHTDLQGAGELAEAIKDYDGRPAVVLANVAPRTNTTTNGCAFAYFWCGKTLVVSTTGGLMLSFVRKFNLATTAVHVVDLSSVVRWLSEQGKLSTDETGRIFRTQFRSLRFQALVAQCIWDGIGIPYTTTFPMSHTPLPPTLAVWFADRFGNLKIGEDVDELGWKEGTLIPTTLRPEPIPFYEMLKSVPEGTLAFTRGSSFGECGLELVVKHGRATDATGCDIGSIIPLQTAVACDAAAS